MAQQLFYNYGIYFKNYKFIFLLKKQQRLEDWECEEIFFNWKFDNAFRKSLFPQQTSFEQKETVNNQKNLINAKQYENS